MVWSRFSMSNFLSSGYKYIFQVFGNIEGLTGLFSMYSWSDIRELLRTVKFDNYKAISKDKEELIAEKCE